MWFALPLGGLWVGNYFMALLTEPKLLIVAPAIALMVGFGLGRLRNPARGLLLAAILLYSLTSVDYYRVKEPWEQVVAPSLAYAQSSDLAMAEIGVGQYPLKYYWQRLMPEGVVFTTFPFLRDPTMSPTTDWYTYYDALLPQLMERSQSTRLGDAATAWLVFWGGDEVIFERLAQGGYIRTMDEVTYHLDNPIHLYRYDQLPETPRARYENGLVLRAAEIDAAALRADLWWSVDTLSAVEGTVIITSTMLFDQNQRPVAQMDSPPYLGQRPAESWSPGEVIFDPKSLALMEGVAALLPGDYTVVAQVYLWSPGGITDIPTTTGDPWVEVGTLRVE